MSSWFRFHLGVICTNTISSNPDSCPVLGEKVVCATVSPHLNILFDIQVQCSLPLKQHQQHSTTSILGILMREFVTSWRFTLTEKVKVILTWNKCFAFAHNVWPVLVTVTSFWSVLDRHHWTQFTNVTHQWSDLTITGKFQVSTQLLCFFLFVVENLGWGTQCHFHFIGFYDSVVHTGNGNCKNWPFCVHAFSFPSLSSIFFFVADIFFISLVCIYFWLEKCISLSLVVSFKQ